jgi:PTS system cellobiose-specific IIC component
VIIGTLHPLNLFIEAQTGMILPQAIMHLLEPLVSASDSLPAILLSAAVPDLLVCRYPRFADCHRHHEPVLDGKPLRQPGCTGAGAALPHVYLQGFWDHYLLIGGVAQPTAGLPAAA